MLLHRQRLDEELLHEAAGEDERLPLRQQDERQKHDRADHGAVEQHGDDSVAHDCLFLEDVIESQQNG